MGQRLGGEFGSEQHRRLLPTAIRGKWLDFQQYHYYGENNELIPAGGLKMKIFGLYDYGYRTTEEVVVSTLTWFLVTWGSFSISKLEAILILGISLYLQERDPNSYYANGSSWIHNIQAGYCWYHYFVKGRREWPVFLGSVSELLSDFGAIAVELKTGEFLYSHKAHYRGATQGMVVAFFFDMFRHKKTGKQHNLFVSIIPFLAIFVMGLRSFLGKPTRILMLSDA